MNDSNNLKGKLLVSAPFLTDIFKRSVILITEHNENGSVGFVINKPTDYLIHDVIDDFPSFDSKVLLGGPVDVKSLNFIHRNSGIEDSYEISDGIYWNGNYESLKILAGTNALDPGDFKFFLGYAGWSPGQLDEELKTSSWYVTDTDIHTIFSEDLKTLWSTTLKNMGGDYKIISTFPEDPSLN